MSNFKYKLKENPIERDSFNYFVDYLKRLGISKYESFLGEPAVEDYESPFKLKNIEEAVVALKEFFDAGKTFFLQIDSDVDGITSAAIFYRYFKDLYPDAKIIYRVHEGKEHGVIFNTIPIEADVIVIPDAGSNQYDEQRQIAATGRHTIILDHHEVDTYEDVENTIIVNNQTSPYFKNKFLSGAGIVYKTIDAFSKAYGHGDAHKKYMDLAALGIISDMMSSKELDNNYIIYHGLKNINSPIFKALLKQQAYSVSNADMPNKIDIAFYVTPLINGVVRVGGVEENTRLFEAFIDYDNTEIFAKSFRGNVSYETYYEKVAREAFNTRNKQNKTKVETMEFLDKNVQDQGLDKNVIITVVTSKDDDITLPKALTGLVAMDFVKKYKKPTLVLRPRTVDGVKCYFGSGRCNPVPGFQSFRDILLESGLVVFAAGHASAFGVGIEVEKLPQLIEYMNKKYANVDFGSEEIEVDYIFSEDEALDLIMLRSFAENSRVYGNGIPEPKFAFRFLINKNTISMLGKKGDTLKFMKNNVAFIKFRADEQMINDIMYGEKEETDSFVIMTPDNFYVDIIGRSQINEFNGTKSIQVIVDNISYERA